MDDAAAAGGCVDDSAAPCYDAHVTAYYDDVSRPEVGKFADAGIFAYVSPAGGGDIALADAYLVQAPGQPSLELATLMRAAALPLAFPVLGMLPPLDLPPEVWLRLLLLLLFWRGALAGAFLASPLVSMAMVWAPTRPSADRLLVRWKSFTAFSVISP